MRVSVSCFVRVNKNNDGTKAYVMCSYGNIQYTSRQRQLHLFRLYLLLRYVCVLVHHNPHLEVGFGIGMIF